MIKKKTPPLRWFVRGDWDGFFGLFIDNVMQLMLVTVLCRYACGFPAEFITERILPGAALSILGGNLFYTWQARRLAEKTGRTNVTALPFGMNTVSLLGFIFLVMGPVYYETGDSDLAWKVGLGACLVSGLIETSGAFFAAWLKRNTPRAALLSGLAGVALTFMALGFSFQIFSAPTIAIVPMMLVLVAYGARLKLPLRLPGGVIAVLIGVAVAWILKHAGLVDFAVPQEPLVFNLNLPKPAFSELAFILFKPEGWSYLAVVIPLGFFNVISSIENLESAEAAGDAYKAKSSLLANGLASIAAAALGSPFPTSIYLGHPGWKAMGARSGYSAASGAMVTLLCCLGGVTALLKIIPLETTLGILIWISLVIVAQAFQETDRKHTVAVVVGLIPAMASWALHIIETSLRAAGTNLYETFDRFGGEIYMDGVIALYQGFLISAILLSAITAFIIDRKFLKAAAWSGVASVLACVGLIHAYTLTPEGIQNYFGWMAAPAFAAAYGAMAGIFLVLHAVKFPAHRIEDVGTPH